MKRYTRFIAMVLVLVLTLQLVPMQAVAAVWANAPTEESGATAAAPGEVRDGTGGAAGTLGQTRRHQHRLSKASGSMKAAEQPPSNERMATTTDGNFTYTTEVLDSGETIAVITRYNGTDTVVRIPQTINDLPVRKIGASAFYGKSNVVQIIIPEGVTTIADATSYSSGAFYDLDKLTTVTLPGTLTHIGKYAFYSCDALAQINFPASVKSIGSDAFYSCDSLTEVTFVEGLETIGSYAFYGCDALTEIRIPGGVTKIGTDAFYSCDALSKATLVAGVEQISGYAFAYCGALSEVVIPFTVSSIDEKAFYQSPNVTILCNPGSYAEEFAREHDIPYHTFAYSISVINLQVLDENGAELDSGYRVEWYADGALVGTGKTLRLAQELEDAELAYQVILEDALLETYYQPGRTSFVRDAEEINLICELESVVRVAVSGSLCGPGGEALSGKLTLVQHITDTHRKTLTESIGADGSFSVTVPAHRITVILESDGMRTRTLEADLTGCSREFKLGSIQMEKLPGNKITLELNMTMAARPGEQVHTVSVDSFDGLSFSVYNETKGREITAYTLQYPHVLLEEGQAYGNDVIRITADGSTTASVRITLDEQCNGSGELRFTEQGRIAINALESRSLCRMFVFDDNGKLCRTEDVYSWYISDGFAPGNYRVVLMARTDLLGSIPDLQTLAEFGLQAGRDYLLLDVSVSDGVVTVLEQLQIPRLDESKLYYTEAEQTFFTASGNNAMISTYVQLRLSYKLKDTVDSTDQKVIIELPDGLVIPDGGLNVDGKGVTYTLQDNILTIPVGKPEGVIRMYVYSTETGHYPIYTRLTFASKGDTVVQPLGDLWIDYEAVRVSLPSETGSKKLTISGEAVPRSVLTVFDCESKIGEAAANAAGRWTAQIELDAGDRISRHEIRIELTNEELGLAYSKDAGILTYDPSIVMVSKVTMYNIGDYGQNTTVFDFINPGPAPSFLFWPGRYPNFSFTVELTGDSSLVEQVYVVTANRNDACTYVECFYDSEKDLWIGTHQYSSMNEVPMAVDVKVIRKPEEEIVLSSELVDEFEQLRTELEQELLSEEEEIIRAAEEEFEAETEGMTIEELWEYYQEAYLDAQRQTALLEDQIKAVEEVLGIEVLSDGAASDAQLQPQQVSGGSAAQQQASGRIPGLLFQTDAVTSSVLVDDIMTNLTFTDTAGVTAEDLLDQGFRQYLTDDGRQYFVQIPDSFDTGVPDDAQITMVDLQNNQAMSIKANNSDGGSIDWDQVGGYMNTAGSLTKNIEDLRNGGMLDALKEQKKLAFKDAHRSRLSATGLEHMVEEMKKTGTPKPVIDNWMEAVNKAKNDCDGLFRKFHDIQGRVDYARSLERLGKLLGIAGFAQSCKGLIDTINETNALKNAYDALKAKCGSNSDYLNLKGEIDGLRGRMALISALFVGVSAVQVCGKITSPVMGILMDLAVLAAQEAADHAMQREYESMEMKLRMLPCNDQELPKEDPPKTSQKMTPIQDPSGYVYEAVPSNRVEGVKAEIYYQGYALDEFGFPTDTMIDILWDAENYDQVNPLYTDANGWYRWDVPEGRWLVKYSKDGYYDTDSRSDSAADGDGYLPVPPPQMEVNTAMISKDSPEVERIYLYQDEIRIQFSQYLRLDSVDSRTVQVRMDGETVSGSVEPVNAESNYEGTKRFASIFSFRPVRTLSGQIDVIVKGVYNYADRKMDGEFTHSAVVKPKPAKLTVEAADIVEYGQTQALKVQILPAEAGAHQELTLQIQAPSILAAAQQTVTADATGTAVFDIIGSLPGSSEVTVCLGDTGLKETVSVEVILPSAKTGTCAKVEASIPNGSIVAPGTELTLTTTTEGAEIYYTLDGTCPCIEDSSSRILYTGPIAIHEDMFLIAYAVKPGLEDSMTAGYLYKVCTHEWVGSKCAICGAVRTNPFTDVPDGSFYHEPVLWAVANGITNGTTATTFGPVDQCLRAHVVTFLWRAVGSPEPETGVNPFVDVKETDFYYKAVMWAAQNGITSGVDATHFGPLAYCNRAQVVTFLYRTMGNPTVDSSENPFTDVPDSQWFTAPVLWAVENGITNGLSAASFGPNSVCNRAQIVTFLYRTYN